MAKKIKKQAVVLRVTDESEFCDDSSHAAVIIISDKTKKLILAMHEQVLKLKKEVGNDVYDLRAFDNTPTLLGESALDEDYSDLDSKVYDSEIVFVSPELAANLEELDTVRGDVSLVQVGEDGFYWTGYYKNTSPGIRYMTTKLSIKDLNKL